MEILFCDLNGTFLNDTPVWEKAMRAMFVAQGKKPLTISEYFREYNGDYLGPYRTRGIHAPRHELDAIYRTTYIADMEHVQSFPGALETLRMLRARGVTIVLLTGQDKDLALPVLERLQAHDVFDQKIYGAHDKTEHMKRVIESESSKIGEKIEHSDCYSIGDSPFDVRQAKLAGVMSVAFLTGYIDYELLIREGPDFSITSFENLTRLR